MTVKELFDFVTDPTVTESNMEEYLAKQMEIASQRPICMSNDQKTEDEVFKQSYIPHTMNEVVDFERDFRRAKQGQPLIYTTLHGIMPDLSKPRDMPEILKEDGIQQSGSKSEEIHEDDESENDDEEDTTEDDDDGDDDSEESEDDDEEEDDELDEKGEKKPKIRTELHMRPRDESPNSKKVSRGILNL